MSDSLRLPPGNAAVFRDILLERSLQDAKWGEQNHTDYKWLTILVEEVGEVAKDALEGRPVYDELVQVAAVAIAWLEALERRPSEN